MKRLIVCSMLLLSGCATYQPRAGYNGVVVGSPSTDSTMIQNPDMINKELVSALAANIKAGTESNIRKSANTEVLGQCRDRALELQGMVVSVSVKVEEKSSGVFRREHKEIKDYNAVMRGRLVDCKTGKVIDDMALEESDGEVQRIAAAFAKDLARFVEFQKQ